MEPVTHILTGAVLARAGFNRRAAYATAAMAIAAEMPDLDTVSSMFGPVAGFEHHRGITHTFAAVPFEAALLTLVFFGVHRMRRRPATRAPTRWGWLFAGTLVALLSHLLLDWTNNYGIRPFFPFNPRWYAGSFVFIFEPVLLAHPRGRAGDASAVPADQRRGGRRSRQCEDEVHRASVGDRGARSRLRGCTCCASTSGKVRSSWLRTRCPAFRACLRARTL